MDSCGIIYFSGTGNTKFVAENMQQILTKKGFNAELINIEKVKKFNSAQYDYIIIGGPVYVERYPEVLLKYVEENLKDFKGECMLFTTQGYNRPTSTFQHAIDRLKNLNIRYCELIPMPNNFYNFMFAKVSKEEEKTMMANSIKLSADAVNGFLNGRTKFYPVKKSKVVMINMVYHLFYPFCTKLITNKIKVDKNKCIHCKLCEKNCPTNCIKITDKVSFNNNCLLCQRCMSRCPKDAFIYKNNIYVQYRPDFKSANPVKSFKEGIKNEK